ncbi:hypothetical protein K469DRAFT_693895 [Zopfia rhizophila CBS 207.26]|uniref:Uncharacterized protein n=1 Tax=Zopfia rhizophila CBS 207.26 TaxID=1314779 RepID=A0A6A6DJG6_9PEZI|nr:hypothetical protein K469DRAFT_693895 [Zopfia rhizophila CBS 207.26]
MSSKECYENMLEGLVRQSGDELYKDSHLRDHHLQHFSVTAKKYLEDHAGFGVIPIALPPLVCKDRYHCAHVSIKESRIIYHKVASMSFLSCGVVQAHCKYGREAAINYAENNWGGDLLGPTWNTVTLSGGTLRVELEDGFYETRSFCGSFELHPSNI